MSKLCTLVRDTTMPRPANVVGDRLVSASASPTFSAAAGPQELGRAQPDTLLAPPGGARPGRRRAVRGDRSGWRHSRPYRRAGRDRRRPATRVGARRAGPPTRRSVTCERADAAEPRRSSSELDDPGRRFRPPRQRTPVLPVVASGVSSCTRPRDNGAHHGLADAEPRRRRVNLFAGTRPGEMWSPASSAVGSRYRAFTRSGARDLLFHLGPTPGGIRETCRPGSANPEGDRAQHRSAGQGPGR